MDSRFTKYFIELGEPAKLNPPIPEDEMEDKCILDLEYAAYYEIARAFGTHNYRDTKIKYDQMIEVLKNFDTKPCLFCKKGTMINNAKIQPYSEFLYGRFFHLNRTSGIYHDQNTWLGSLGWTCYHCETAETYPPKDNARIWQSDDADLKKKRLADYIFTKKPIVNSMSLEGVAGRGWLLKVGDTWFCNKKSKDKLIKLWSLR